MHHVSLPGGAFSRKPFNMRVIEKLGKKIGRVAFGGAAISGEGRGYGFGSMSEEDAVSLLLRSREAGINLYDFAPIYGFNLAEKRAGVAFRKTREEVLLVSKCGVSWHENGRVDMSNDPKTCLKMLDQSLKNFQSDYIDIYLVHWPDPKVDIRRTLEPLYAQKEKGKINYLGLCNTNSNEYALAKEVAPIDVVQMERNFFTRENFQTLELEKHVLTMGWGTFDKGILTGSVTPDRKFEKDDCRSWAPWWKKSDWKEKALFTQSLTDRLGIDKESLGRASLSYSLAEADCAICGVRNAFQLEKTVAWSDKDADYEELEDAFSSF